VYRNRLLQKTLKQVAKTFPVIVITGPRQSGKSTLLRKVLANKASFINMDDPNLRNIISDNPMEYLKSLKLPIVIDEVQYMPEIMSYIKIIIDEKRKPGSFFLTGSQNFIMMRGLSESLAGRAAILSLPSFQLQERKLIPELYSLLVQGSYPEVVIKPKINIDIWYSSYMQTYIQRDLRSLLNVSDLRSFEQFLRLLAARVSQELNLSHFANDLGVSVPTISRWISILESSYIIFLLPPYFQNFGKRIIKSPKLYFYDTGMILHLLNLKEKTLLVKAPFVGAIFENLVVSEVLKKKFAEGKKPEIYYWRSQSGIEVDLIYEENGSYIPCEIKLSKMIKPEFAKNLKLWMQISGVKSGLILSNCTEKVFLSGNIKNKYWKNI
jgi:hypothetical protein